MAPALHIAPPMDRLRQVALACLFTSIALAGGLSPRVSRADGSGSGDDSSVSIPLNDNQLPASDLIYSDNGQTRMLSPEDAWQLKQSGVDLSKLEPDGTTDIFKGTPRETQVIYKGSATTSDLTLDSSLPIQDWDYVNYVGVITASSGRFKFNVETQPQAGDGKTLTLMLSTDIHTFLLRKELLRKLGYQIPAMKWIKDVKVRFPDLLTETFFLKTQIPNSTDGASSRWCRVSTEAYNAMKASAAKGAEPPCLPDPGIQDTDPLLLTFQDVIAMDATPLYYNVAIGPPIEQIPGTTNLRPEGPRILRALALPYSLVNVPESVNQVDWYDGNNQNGTVVLQTPDDAVFATTLDDALWMLRKIAALSRGDFQQIVANSFFPEPVAKILVEKLISRRNSLLELFNLSKIDHGAEYAQSISFDPKITELPDLKNGKVIDEPVDASCQAQMADFKTTSQACTWAGYASRYAWGDPESPLHGLGWFGLSELEGNATQSLLQYANGKLPQLSEMQDIQNHTQDALTKFFETGQNELVQLGTWIGPIANGNVGVSRNVVLGDYLGTNNLVQLADTFTISATAGIMIGFDGMPTSPVPIGLQGLATGQVSLSLTHLKPLTALKQAVTEPIQNEFVPWIFYNAAHVLSTVADAQSGGSNQNVDQLKKQLSDDMDRLKNFMGVGDSLIITESLNGTENLSMSAQEAVAFSPSVSITPGLTQIVMSRLQFYRKDENTIQVFKDNGELYGANISFTFGIGPANSPAQFPVISVTAQKSAGSAQTKSFTVNINPDPTQNSNLYTAAAALSSALRTSSIEVLEHSYRPSQVQVKFNDTNSSMNFFHWMRRTLKSNGTMAATLWDGTSGNFIDLTDGAQTGKHYQNLATQAATFLTQYLSNNANYSINTQAAPNPGQSFLGSSQTRDTELQGSLDPNTEGGLADAFFRVHYRWEGWSMSAKDLEALTDSLSAKYGFPLYAPGFLGDTQTFKMYEVSLFVDIYEAGLKNLVLISNADFNELNNRLRAQNNCDVYDEGDLESTTAHEDDVCWGLRSFLWDVDHYRRDYNKAVSSKNAKKYGPKLAHDMFNAAKDLEKFVSFADLVKLVGGVKNLYVFSTVTGFREGSEIISNPISSNTFGTCTNPDGQACDASNPQPSGIIDEVQNIMGIQDGEFKAQWLRGVL